MFRNDEVIMYKDGNDLLDKNKLYKNDQLRKIASGEANISLFND